MGGRYLILINLVVMIVNLPLSNMFLAQLGEASAHDFMKVCNFSLSLTAIAFAWFTSLLACSIGS
jgi:hypothetical protein